MSFTTTAALQRLEALQHQNPPTRLRSICDRGAPVLRTFPSQDALLQYTSLPGQHHFLTIALPNNFVSWVVELSSWFETMLAGEVEEDLPLLYTAARFGQAQLCGQPDDMLQHICRVLENELGPEKNHKMAAWEDVGTLSRDTSSRDRSIGFENMELNPATISQSGKRKFNFRCNSCHRLGICVCMFVDFLEQLEALAKVAYCAKRVMRGLAPALAQRESKGWEFRRECFCQENKKDSQLHWTRVFTCSHIFHIECIGPWIMARRSGYGLATCPMCRAAFRDQELGWMVTDYMRYIWKCYTGLYAWNDRLRLALEKGNDDGKLGPMRLDPERDLRVAPYEILSAEACAPLRDRVCVKALALRAR